MKKILILKKLPTDNDFHLVFIDNSLEDLQKNVGGHIETVTMGSFVVICNENGRNEHLPFNISIGGVEFVGPIIIAGVKGDTFTDVPLQLRKISPDCKECEKEICFANQ